MKKSFSHYPIPLLLINALLLVAAVFFFVHGIQKSEKTSSYDDGLTQIDPNTIHLTDSHVTVSFSDVILAKQNETRKLIVSTQEATVSASLEKKLIEALDLDILKKSQTITYTGKGYFVVDLSTISTQDIITDDRAETITILIDHAYLEDVDVDPNRMTIGETKESLLNRGAIKMTVRELNDIEKQIRSRLETAFNTAENGQLADDNALKMVKEVYEPVIKAVDDRYTLQVSFR